jgi:DNA-binding LytR/AlgR family response regulator
MQNYFFIWKDGGYNKLPYSDIVYVESLKNYVRIIAGKKNYMVLTTLKRVEEILPRNELCRIHRCYIVSLSNIIRFTNNKIWIGDKQLPISESYQKLLMEKVITLVNEPRLSAKISKKTSDNILKSLN